MPFTVSHAAAAIVLKPLRLPLAPLVIGTMSPDLPYFIGLRHAGGFTHSIVGVLAVAVPATLLLTAVWVIVLRPAIRDLAPTPVRRRWHPPRQRWRRWRWWPAATLAAAIGALTHVVWDSFTHADAWGTRAIAWLGEQQGPLPGYQWAQYLSGVVGLAVIGIALITWWVRAGRLRAGTLRAGRLREAPESRRTSSAPTAARGEAETDPAAVLVPGRVRRVALIAVPFVLAFATGVITLCFPSVPKFSSAHGFIVLTTTMGVFAGGVVVAAALWWVLLSSSRD